LLLVEHPLNNITVMVNSIKNKVKFLSIKRILFLIEKHKHIY